MTSLVPCNRFRMVVFGERKSGKSALISQLKSKSGVLSPTLGSTSAPPSPAITPSPSSGLSIHEWQTNMKVITAEGKKAKEGTIHVWEFSERDLEYEIHTMFITENCLPVIVWNMADGDERYVGHCLQGVNARGTKRNYCFLFSLTCYLQPKERAHQLLSLARILMTLHAPKR